VLIRGLEQMIFLSQGVPNGPKAHPAHLSSKTWLIRGGDDSSINADRRVGVSKVRLLCLHDLVVQGKATNEAASLAPSNIIKSYVAALKYFTYDF
jgi:hypothetical protein